MRERERDDDDAFTVCADKAFHSVDLDENLERLTFPLTE